MSGGREIAAAPTNAFQGELDAYGPNLQQALPSHVSVEKFKRVLITAVSSNPDLLYANRRTLFTAAVKCASDGLFPDGREAALVVYSTKVKQRDPNTGLDVERRIDAVTYMPMVAGIRKRMRNSGDVLSAIAEVVHKNDHFKYQLGDNAGIVHEPPGLGEDRGEAVGAYAIVTLKSGEVLRDVMSKKEIENTRNQSRAKDSLMWRTFWGEGAKKTVLRRCAKSAPQSAEYEALFDRADEPAVLDAPAGLMLPEPEPEPQRQIAEREPEPSYLVVDVDGEEHEFATADRAEQALRVILGDAAKRGRPLLQAAGENNAHAIQQLREDGRHDLAASLADYYRDLRADLDPFGLPPLNETNTPSSAGLTKGKLGSAGAADEGVAAATLDQWQGETEMMAAELPTAMAESQTAPPASESRDSAVRPAETERTHSAPADDTARPFATTATAASAAPISSVGPNATTTASRSDPADLLGDPPAENLTVPLPRDPSAGDLDYFGRQLIAMIAEAPGDRSRMALIRMSNENGLSKLKAGAPAMHDDVRAALAGKAG